MKITFHGINNGWAIEAKIADYYHIVYSQWMVIALFKLFKGLWQKRKIKLSKYSVDSHNGENNE